jgi:hypothetical protein
MTKIVDEVLAANGKYAEASGTKATCHCLRAAISRFSPVWMPALIRQNTPVWPKATPM